MAERTFDLGGVMEALSDAMIAVDRRNHIVAANAGLTGLLGWSSEALVGRSLRVVLPTSFDEVEDHAKDMLGEAILLPARRADGSEVDVEGVFSRVAAEEGPLLLVTLRDVGARATLERWTQSDRSLLAQYEVMTMLARGGTLAGEAEEILRCLSQTLGWDAGLYWEPDETSERLVLRQWWLQEDGLEASIHALAERPLRPGEGVAGEAWESRWLSTWRHEQAGPGEVDADRAAGVREAIALPVVWGRRVHAVLSFLSTRKVPRDEKALQTLSMMGLQMGQFMERLGIEAEARARAQWLSTTLRSIGDAVIATDLEGRLAFMNPVAETLTGWSGEKVEGQRLEHVFRILHPISRAPLDMPTVEVLQGKEPPARGHHMLLVARDGSERIIEHDVAPIRTDEGAMEGAVVVFRDATEKIHKEAEFARLLTSEQLARASADFQRELAAFLDEATTALGSSLDAETTYEELAGLAVPRLADWCAVHVDAGPERSPRAQVLRGRNVHLTRQLAALLESAGMADRAFGIPGVLEEAAEHSFIVDAPRRLIEDRVHDATLRPQLLALGFTSFICLPLVARGKRLGWMSLAATSNYRQFGMRDVGLFQELAARAGQALENVRLYREAQEAVRIRDDFLSIASHELRTPLTPLQLQLQALLRALRNRQPPPTPERITEKLEVIARQVVRLERLVTSLLDISRITGKRLVLELEEVDLEEVVAELVERNEAHAQQQGSPLRFVSPGPTIGRWDRMRLEQIVSNLLSNALKFGAGRPVTVIVVCEEDAAWLRVVDQGIGIPPTDQSRIFERFERAVTMRHFGGFGLGLWIVRQLVEAMGGSVRVQSVAGEGSTFEVRLPREPPAPSADADPRLPA